MLKSRVLLGMSGGTDSAVSAMLLKEQGYELVGITFLFTDYSENNRNIIQDASELADDLKIEYHIIDLREEFEDKIIKKFNQDYLLGKTPFPCAFCNPDLKFKNLIIYSEKFDCQYIATGHYAKIVEYNEVKFIAQGANKNKDQSFFLWSLKNEIINKLIFPLGNWNKEKVRDFAKQHGYIKISHKKDSLGICFIDGGDYRNWLKDRGISSEQGNFIDKDGKVLGKHKGIVNYTIGQRHGLGINTNKRLFVAEIKSKENIIVLDEYDSLFKTRIYVKDINLIDFQSFSQNKAYILKIRYRLQENPCYVKIIDNNRAILELLKPVAMVANGQAAVLYEENRLIGGGFIEKSE